MADKDAVRSFEQIKAYPLGDAQGGRAIQSVKGQMSENDGTGGHRTILRETSEGRAIARTRDHMPMVEIEKRKCELGVDHGTIDILNIAPEHPDSYKNGKLYFTPFVQAHISGAAEDDPYRPIVDEIEPPDDIKGEAPADGADAKSLSKNKKGDNAGDVYTKKIMMGRCPSSIFTGRARLYVQAVYGRHDALDLVSLSPTSYVETPSLILGDLTPVTLHTSCGIYFDSVTAEHWLICVNASTVDFYPMQAAECVEELRDFLLGDEISAADKERVETYILSDCAPVVEKKQTVSITTTGNSSMGYGWHFNWDGDRCDIVHNDIVAHSGGGYENSSTHYRLTFSMSRGMWSANRTIVEGPKLWKSLRHVEPITYPNWEYTVLDKFGANTGPLTHGNAPYYVFYNKNELRVCRYSSTTHANVAYSGVTREPWYYDPSNNYTSVGSDAVYSVMRDDWDRKTVSFLCGNVSVSYDEESYTESVYIRSSPDPENIKQKAVSGVDTAYASGSYSQPIGQPSVIPTSQIYNLHWGTIDTWDGTPCSGYATQTIEAPTSPQMRWTWGLLYCRANTESYGSTVYSTTQFISVIPFCDAEAIYLYGQYDRSSHEIGSSRVDHAAWFNWYGWEEINSIEGVYGTPAEPGGIDYQSENYQTFDRTINTQNTASKLVCNKGTFNNVTMPGKSGFWSVNESIPQQYPTFSSASGNSVMAPQNAVDSGNSTLTGASIYVGWA